MIQFRLDQSGVPTYLQLVQQIRQAVRLGILQPGDQLPTVKEVVASLAINPNTVLKAYRELDLSGRSEEHTSELQSHVNLVCRLLLEKKKKNRQMRYTRSKKRLTQ